MIGINTKGELSGYKQYLDMSAAYIPLLCPIRAIMSYFCIEKYNTTERKSAASFL
jgi:hypothetical protein